MLGNDLELCPVQNFKKIGSELGLVIYAWALTQYPESGLGPRKNNCWFPIDCENRTG